AELGGGVGRGGDKVERLGGGGVIAELTGRGLPGVQAVSLAGALTASDAAEQIRDALKSNDEGAAGLDEVDSLLRLVGGQLPGDRVVFTPRLVRGLSYYTGPIWEVAAAGGAGSLAGGGRYDHLIEQLGGPDVPATGGGRGVGGGPVFLAPQGAPATPLDLGRASQGGRAPPPPVSLSPGPR